MQDIRPGSRGGKDQFKWDDVRGDKHRENYLGHSLMAPVGRWQQGKDLTWYSKGKKGDAEIIRRAEIRATKQKEADYMAAVLGYKTGVSVVPTGELTKHEIDDVCKRGLMERDDKDIERVQGMGYSGMSSAKMNMLPLKALEGGSQGGAKRKHELTDERLRASRHDHERGAVSVGKPKKHKRDKEKKKKKRKHRGSDSEKESSKKRKKRRRDSDD
eukprot:m.33820 g.33820  ORF g.33820 m.33820 type:complete len:215 (+) comp31901_c0_seq1:86-730(+)